MGTGHQEPNLDKMEHVGSYQAGPFVWHCFEYFPEGA